jgi:hypothetical protein
MKSRLAAGCAALSILSWAAWAQETACFVKQNYYRGIAPAEAAGNTARPPGSPL